MIATVGIVHQGCKPRAFRMAVSSRPIATAAAIVQSSPIMKWYQNLKKPITHDLRMAITFMPQLRSRGRDAARR